jgi:hypothetical protein
VRTSLDARAVDGALRFTRSANAAQLLNTVLTGHPQPWMAGSRGPVEVRSATVLRAHAGSRLALRYAIRWGRAERALIAKFYVRDRSDVARTLASLIGQGLGPDQSMQVAAPIAYVPEIDLLLMEEAPGLSAREALRHGQSGVGERTAQWLAAFHAAAPLPAAYGLREPVCRARRWAEKLNRSAPALAPQTRHLFATLAATQPDWPPEPCLAHGDFSISHVYLAAQTTIVIDWDSWTVGDCAEDAGRFMASLHHLAARDPERYRCADREAQAFAQTYLSLVPMARHSLAFHEALACLRTAARLVTGAVPHRIRYAQVMLAAGMQALGTG